MNTIWPSEYLQSLHILNRNNPDDLICFLASPFSSNKDRYESILRICNNACNLIQEMRQIHIKCIRGDSYFEPTIIQQDIWEGIQNCDLVIIDISEFNMNVSIELGVAAAIRRKENVIILIDTESTERYPFDFYPCRYISYKKDLSDENLLTQKLQQAIEYSLIPAPYTPNLDQNNIPQKLDLSNPDHCKFLLSPSNSHRKISPSGMEFGSLYFFQNSWTSLAQKDFRNVKLSAKMEFCQLRKDIIDDSKKWMGISLRNQHFYSNFGYLISVHADNKIRTYLPVEEYSPLNEEVVTLPSFSINSTVDISIELIENFYSAEIHYNDNSVFYQKDLSKNPFIYNSGKITFQTYNCRAKIKTIDLLLLE